MALVVRRKIAGERAHEHRSLHPIPPRDGIRRQLAYDAEQIPKMAPAFDPFFGSSRWQEIVARRVTESQGSTCSRELVELYLGRLRNLWEYADQIVDVRLRGDQGLYRMLFAADAEAAKRIATWVKKRLANRDQLMLF
jgi:hypothetical protein